MNVTVKYIIFCGYILLRSAKLLGIPLLREANGVSLTIVRLISRKYSGVTQLRLIKTVK